jgi:hypothetical protein
VPVIAFLLSSDVIPRPDQVRARTHSPTIEELIMYPTTPSPLDGVDLAGELVGEDFDGWSDDLRAEFITNQFNYEVGTVLWSQNDRVKVWYIRVPPGERLGAHRHVLDYFWTALKDGVSIQHTDDGTTRRVRYRAGDTRHLKFGPGKYLLHDLCNDGTTDLEFMTVEHVRRPGEPGPPAERVSDSVVLPMDQSPSTQRQP